VATGISVGAVILLAPMLAALIGWKAPRSVGLLAVADWLLAATTVLLLIGWVGLLYLPAWVVFLIATGTAAREATARRRSGVR
jgi:hypothetical protein